MFLSPEERSDSVAVVDQHIKRANYVAGRSLETELPSLTVKM